VKEIAFNEGFRRGPVQSDCEKKVDDSTARHGFLPPIGYEADWVADANIQPSPQEIPFASFESDHG
jgi:hypothetical protein